VWCCKANEKKITLLDWKQNRANHVYILSSTLTAKTIIKPTQTNVSSGNITSIGSGIQENTKNFTKVKDNQFIQL